MNKVLLSRQRQSIFKKLEKEFTDELVPASYSGETEGQAGVLTIFVEDLAGEGVQSFAEYFFMPMDEKTAGMQLFVNLFTVIDETDENNRGELMAAVSILNNYLPLGAFAFDPAQDALVYRYTHVMAFELSETDMYNEMQMSMSASMQVMERFSYLLLEVNDGQRSAGSISELLNPAEQPGEQAESIS